MNLLTVASLIGTLALASLLAAQESQPAPQPQLPPAPMVLNPLITTLDANKDGKLSSDEIANASKSLLKLDKNGNGELDPAEFGPTVVLHGASQPGTAGGAMTLIAPGGQAGGGATIHLSPGGPGGASASATLIAPGPPHSGSIHIDPKGVQLQPPPQSKPPQEPR
jgi:hypothetical protein